MGKRSHKPKYRHNLVQRANAAKKRLKKKKDSKSTELIIKEAWDTTKTARENVASMGLAFNPNEVIPLHKSKNKFISLEDIPKALDTLKPYKRVKKYEKMKTEKAPVVISTLERDASTQEALHSSQDRKFRMHERDVELCIYLIERYGDDFRVSYDCKYPGNMILAVVSLLDQKYTQHNVTDDHKMESICSKEAMARDHENLFQYTPKQIEKKIKQYKQSDLYKTIQSV